MMSEIGLSERIERELVVNELELTLKISSMAKNTGKKIQQIKAYGIY